MDTQDKLRMAAEFLDSAWDGDRCIYYDDGSGWNYICESEYEMLELYDLLHHPDADVRRDAYSHWCGSYSHKKFGYVVSRIYDDGGDWGLSPDGVYPSIKAARAAAVQYIDAHANEGEYDQADGCVSVDIHYAIVDGDGDQVDTGTHTAVLSIDEDALAIAAGAPPDCIHVWADSGEGADDKNSDVKNLGGTTYLHQTYCVRCGIVRETLQHGTQRNPGEADTVTFHSN